MRAGLLAFSAQGEALAGRIGAFLQAQGWETDARRCAAGGLRAWAAHHFTRDDALIFVSSCGIAVRAVAPFVNSKLSDPAVLAADEGGRYVIPLLSGHIGGANALARTIAGFLGAEAVVTTATDIHGLFAADTWAKSQGLAIVNPERIRAVSGKLLSGGTIHVYSAIPIRGTPPEGVILSSQPDGADVVVSWRAGDGAEMPESEPLRLVPPSLVLGVGCRRGIAPEALFQALEHLLRRAGCWPSALRQACSIDLKAEEPGLLAFCSAAGLPFSTFAAEELRRVPGTFDASPFVRSVTGVDNVCERAAVLGSGNGRLIAGKYAENGVTMALAESAYPLGWEERLR